jgi:hypothetical protein
VPAASYGRAWRDNGLSIVLVAAFLAMWLGQAMTGWSVYNSDRRDQGMPPVSFAAYLQSGHFGEATFENWESEFLQMAGYVLLTVFLFQRGSSESKRPGAIELVDVDAREAPNRRDAPWPVRSGGLALRLYEHSLSIAFGAIFLASFCLHATTGARAYSEEQIARGGSAVGTLEFITTSQFWFESFQNWQSEFLSLFAMVVLSIVLRQRGSPESKPVHAPTWETG